MYHGLPAIELEYTVGPIPYKYDVTFRMDELLLTRA